MSSAGRSTIDIAIGRAREGVVHAGVLAGRASRWSDRHLWGGSKTLWILIGLLLLGALLWVLHPTQTARTGRGFGGATPVGVATAVRGDVNVTLDALGTVAPLATVTVRPQVSGQIINFYFNEGQMVKAGDLLAQIDPRPFQAALDQANGQLARDAASLANAQVDLKRDQALYASNAVSQQVRDTQAALVRSDQGIVVSDKANVESAAINLAYSHITSPVAGRVGIRQVDVGNLVQAGQTNGIVVVTQLQPISVLFTVPEDDVGNIVPRVQSGEKLAADVYDRAQLHKLASGTLSAVDSEIDTTTGTVKLRAMFDNSDFALFPAQFVNVQLRVATLHDQTVVPSAAIQRGAEGTYVYVVNSDSTVSMRTVTTGQTDKDRVAISQGLKPGEVVVIDGADRLRDGADVILPKGQKGASASTAAAAGAPQQAGANSRGAFRAKMAAAMKQYCSDDIAKYCPNMKPGTPELRQCVRQNRDSFSDSCRQGLAKLRHSFGGGGGFGGGSPQ